MWVALAALVCLLAGLYAGGTLRVAAVAAVAVAGMTAANQLADEGYSLLDDLVFFTLMLGTPALIGRLLRLRATLIAELREQAQALEAAHAEEATAAVAEERARLALAVHDAVAHRIGEIALLAAGAQRLAGREPDRAVASLARIERTARAALDDIREVIGVLRRGDDLLEPAAPTSAAVVPAAWLRRPASAVAPESRRRAVTRSDVALGVAVFVAMSVETVTSSRLEGPAPANVAGVAAIAAPLVFLRAAPLPAAAATYGLAAIQALLLTPPTLLVTPLVLLLLPPYSVATHLPLQPALAGLVLCVAGAVAIEPSIPALALGVLAWVAGRAVREREQRVAELRDVTRRLELASDATAARARGEERLRVARELHDAVAHSMTVVVLQAEAAQRLWTADPAAARGATDAVGAVAREVLGDLRLRLRSEGGARLGALDGLLARMRPLGLDIRVARCDTELPADIAHVAFCILQEALTNAARYAAPTIVRVDIRRAPDGLRIDVADDGCTGSGRRRDIAGTGTGLRGMAERVAACGGELRYGPAGRGFRLEARLPLTT